MSLVHRDAQKDAQKDFILTLDDILPVYREVLGSGALLVNGFFRRTVRTKDGTAAIGRNGDFYYNPEWFQKWITNPARLRDIAMHELMHPVLGDLSRDMNELANLAGDIVINAMLYTLDLAPCELFKTFYSSTEDPECLLRAGSTPPQKVRGIYASVYPGAFANLGKLQGCRNPLEIMQALHVVYGDEMPSVTGQLLGSHMGSLPTKDEDGNPIDSGELGIPGEITSDVAEICDEILEEKKTGGGYNDTVGESIVNVIKSRRRIRTELLKGFETRNIANKLKQYFHGVRNSRSIVPVGITRNEALRVIMGTPPLFFRRKAPVDNIERRGIAMYLDVSGSVFAFLPQVIGIFESLRADIEHIHQFSNQVTEVKRDEFLQGKILTTGGTDFNCVIAHAVKMRFPKVLIFTDGDANADEEHQALARKHIAKMGLVYFGNYVRANWIEETYKCHFTLSALIGEAEGEPGSLGPGGSDL